MAASLSYQCWVIICASILCIASGDRDEDTSTSGFLELDSVARRAIFVHTDLIRSRANQQRIIPDIKFTCSGSIHKWIFIGRYRDDDRYPEFQIWETDDDIRYTRAATFSPGNRNCTDRVRDEWRLCEYNLMNDEPTQFEAGDVFGLHQPRPDDSSVAVGYQEGGGPINYRRSGREPRTEFDLNDMRFETDESDYPLVAVEASPPECVTGFLQREMLETQFLGGEESFDLVLRRGQQRVFTGIPFACTGTLTKWIIGAGRNNDIVNTNYPELQIWRQSQSDGDIYNKVANSTITDPVVTGDLNVYEYTPDPPLPFQDGDVLGVFQPVNERVVVNYVEDEEYQPQTSRINTNSPAQEFDLDEGTEGTNLPLVTVEIEPTGGGDVENCLGEFIDRDALVRRALQTVVAVGGELQLQQFVDAFDQQHIIPSMRFTTDGLLRTLLFAAVRAVDVTRSEFPELQIWRMMDETDTYNRVYPIDATAVPALTVYLNVYQYIVDPPFPIQSGDVLGIYQPPEASSQLSLAYVEESGHVNYIFEGGRLESLILSDADESLLVFLFPLVTVEFEPNESAPTASVSPTSTTNSVNPQPMESNILPTDALPGEPSETPSDDSSRSSSSGGSDSSNTVAVIGGGVGAGVLVVVLLVVTTILFLRWKRTKLGRAFKSGPEGTASSATDALGTTRDGEVDVKPCVAYGRTGPLHNATTTQQEGAEDLDTQPCAAYGRTTPMYETIETDNTRGTTEGLETQPCAAYAGTGTLVYDYIETETPRQREVEMQPCVAYVGTGPRHGTTD